MYSIYITKNVWTIIKVYYSATIKSQAKSCDPKNKNSGAKHNMSEKLYLLYILIWKAWQYTTCITGLTWADNLSDMDCE